jgi:oligopeptide transport system ATP-binding protein
MSQPVAPNGPADGRNGPADGRNGRAPNGSLVDVRNLKMYFPINSGVLQRRTGWVQAVDDVSFEIGHGETLGLVGESGCGKTTVGRALLQVYRPTAGAVLFDGVDLTTLSPGQLRARRRDFQMIFQDPYASLDPRAKVADIVAEPIEVHDLARGAAKRARVAELLHQVGLNAAFADRYPHEFSGGQRQRIGIARALAASPKFIVCDEPISALDVSIQAQIINLLERLRDELGLTYLFIAHDLAVVRHLCTRIAVMYLGKLVEVAPRTRLYARPLHPYTKALLSAVPLPDPRLERQRERIILTGDVPSPINPPSGCRFHPRCPYAQPRCAAEEPALDPEHGVACHYWREIEAGALTPLAART